MFVAAVVLLTPAFANGFPFLFFDTESYYLLGHSILNHLGGLFDPKAAVASAAGSAAPDLNASLSYVGGRSALYALTVAVSEGLGSFWLLAALQSLVAAWVLSAAVRAADPNRPVRTYWLVVGLLLTLSALPFYVAFTMPDVFAGLLLAILAVLGFASDRFGWLERWALVLAAGASAAMHTTNLALAALALLVFGVAAAVMRPGWSVVRRRLVLTALPLVLSLLFGFSYSTATRMALGEAPHNPPYLTARVLADGPGRAFLRDRCGKGATFEICRYADRRLDDHNSILWSLDPERGVFQFADAAGRRKLIEEEKAFVLAVVRHDPAGQIAASLHNGLRQLLTYRISADLGWARQTWDEMRFAELTPGAAAGATGSLAYRGLFPFDLIDLLQLVGVGLAIAGLAWRGARGDMTVALRRPAALRSPEEAARASFLILAMGLVFILVANAVLCGALSGPQDRYQVRILWLLPLLAALMIARFGGARRSISGDRASHG